MHHTAQKPKENPKQSSEDDKINDRLRQERVFAAEQEDYSRGTFAQLQAVGPGGQTTRHLPHLRV